MITRSLCLAFLAILLTITGQAQIISDFSIDADGWSCFNVSSGASSAVTYNSTGGNPGGNISFTTSTTSATSYYFNGPAKFNGNLSTSYNQNLSFDLMQSTFGSDNSVGDLIITGGSTTIVYQLPTQPNAGSWSSYVIPLKETATGWHINNVAGAAPTKDQFKAALSSVTVFRIRVKYLAGTSGLPYTGFLDNVILSVQTTPPPPTVTSISPALGIPNVSTITVHGTNFNTTPSQNIVYFSGVKATVATASSTQLTVKVPQGAQFGRLTVLNLGTGLSAQSLQNFSPQYDNNKDFGGRIIPSSLAPKIKIPLDATTTNKSDFTVGDVDGDGWNDLVVSEFGIGKVSIWRNLQVAGSISPGSFAKIGIPISITAGKGNTVLADFDGDGKLDLAVGTGDASAHIAIFRNTSAPGTISFAPVDYMAAASYVDGPIHAADMDGDGRPELMSSWDNSSGGPGTYFSIFPNLSTPGDIEFAPLLDFDFGIVNVSEAISTGDLDGDGKLDIAVVGDFNTDFHIYQNTSTPGNFSFNTPFLMNSGGSAQNVAIADFDNDNKMDLAWCGYNTNSVLVAKNIFTSGVMSAASFGAPITLTSPLGYIQGKVAVADINSDSKPDIVLAGSTDMAIIQNRAVAGVIDANTFMPGTPFPGNGGYSYFTGPILADFDADGKLDIVLGETAESPNNLDIYQNQCYPVPVIASVTPSPSSPGGTLTLTGDLMLTGKTTPTVTVRDGILKSTSNTPSNTTTTMTLPAGGKTDQLSVTVHGLTGTSKVLANVFPTNRVIDATAFPAVITFPISSNIRNTLVTADWDDDGKPDVGLIDGFTNGKVFQNTQAAVGPITTASLTQVPTVFTASYFITAFDIDGDGKTDMHLDGTLFRNSSSAGTISFASSPGGVSTTASGYTYAIAADFNGDGKIDIAGNNGANVALFENLSGTGAFVNNSYLSTFGSQVLLPRPASGGGIISVDFDGDGNLDIATTNTSSNNFSYYQNLGVKSIITTASFALAVNVATGLQPFGLIAADYDGDGKQDVAITHYNAANNYVSVYRNTSTVGAISFAAPVNFPCLKNGFDIIAQDLDGDAKPEMIVIHQPNPGPGSFSIFKNTSTSGSTSFATVVNYPLPLNNPQFVASADINLDNKPDLVFVAGAYGTGSNALLVAENKIFTPTIVINTQPAASASLCDGAIQTLTTNATGTTNIAYQWQIFNSGTGGYVDLTNTGGYSNVSTATLSINTSGNFGSGTYQCKISGDFAATVYTTQSVITVNANPGPPGITAASACLGGSATLNASGAVNGQYRWYNWAGVALPADLNSNYIISALDSAQRFFVSINNGVCESTRVPVIATLNATPNPPTTTGGMGCQGTSVTVHASGGTDGQYRWYDWQGVSIAGQVNSSFAIASLDSTETFHVSITNGSCESARTTVVATLAISGCNGNLPPVIIPTDETTSIGGQVTLDLTTIVSDPNNNLDLSTLAIISQPQSGAQATIDSDHELTVNYSGLSFSGTDRLSIQVCDITGACAQQEITIEVVGSVIVYNAVSPNGDGKNDLFVLEYIDVLPDTQDNRVSIFNRWGDEVYSVSNYNNTTRAFGGVSSDGKQLPPGTYFYKVVFTSGIKSLTGYLQINR